MAHAHLLEVTTHLAARLHEAVPAELSLETDEAITSLLRLIGDLRRHIDAVGSELAAEVERRSADAETSLSRRLGERTPGLAVARLAGIDPAEAQDWCAAGLATTRWPGSPGEILPPMHEAVAAALHDGDLSPRATRTIVTALDDLALRASTEDVTAIERVLLDHAQHLTPRELARLCRTVTERFDPEGAWPREEELRARSGVSIVRGRDGMVTWILKLHPEAAGFLTAAVDARTAPRRLPTFSDTREVDPASSDPRPLSQKRLDALVSIARESLGRDHGRVAGTAVTMNVTMTLESLMSGLGAAHIDGIDEPISASTARRLAAEAAIIPLVLGSSSEPLDVGRTSRLFTEAQRHALAVRDGGCIWPGCDAPPGWCEVAHLTAWASGGPTDLGNGALMCPFHHRRFDNDGWSLEWRNHAPWLIPPPRADATRTPRRAGRVPMAA